MKITILDRKGTFVTHLEWNEGDVKARYGEFDRDKDFKEWVMLQKIKTAVSNARVRGCWNAKFDTNIPKLFVHPILCVPNFLIFMGQVAFQ